MKKITTVFYVFAVLVLFVLITGCGSSKKETAESDALTDADNDIAADGDVDADVKGITSNDALRIQEFLLGKIKELAPSAK